MDIPTYVNVKLLLSPRHSRGITFFIHFHHTLKRMDLLLEVALKTAFKWWRVTGSVAAATGVAWIVDTFTSVHSVRLTYSLMLLALVAGIVWHRGRFSAVPPTDPHSQVGR